jgi:hypothetical protein
MDWCVYRHMHPMAPTWRYVFELHIPSGERKFPLRQGLWIEDLQIPPGQECSNGSMILLAVVLWRAFLG